MSSSLSIGDVVDGRYEIRAALAESPAYLAYKAFDREIEVEVALWWMRIELFPEGHHKSSFVGAVVDLRAIRHANLRRMFEAGYGSGYLYATAQLDTDDQFPLRPGSGRVASEPDLVHYATSVAGALEAAYEAGHVHGRLVPTDVAHVAGLLKVGGVGLYRDVDPGAAALCWRAQERYVSPEVRGGAIPTPAADVYSMARLLAELATGRTPDDTEQLIDLVEQHRPELANTLEAAMSLAPHRRPQSPAELLEAVRYGLIDERIPTAEAKALPRPSSDVILLTKQTGRSAVPRGKPGPAPRSGPHATTLLEGQPASPQPRRGAKLPGKTIPDSDGPAGVRAPIDFGLDDEETIDEGAARQPPLGGAPGADPERTMEDPKPNIPGVSAAQMVREGAPRRPLPASSPGLGVGASYAASGAFDPDQTAEDRGSSRGGRDREEALRESRPVSRRSDPSIRFVSMKPKTEPDAKPKTPVIPAIDRPEMKPVLRPLSSLSSSGSYPPGTLGRYAPPRQVAAPAARRSRGRLWLWLALGVVALAAGGFAVWYFALRATGEASHDGGGRPPRGSARPSPAPTSTPLRPAREPGQASPPAVPSERSVAAGTEKRACPAQMVLVEEKPGFCIDLYESPGKGRMPATGVTFAQAAATCRSRGARLCTEAEWEAACRGEADSSYPYGSTYRRGVCNTDGGAERAIAVAGEFADCVSAAGVFDMSGNVAEWVAGGGVRGGSALDRADGRCSRSRRLRGTQAEGFSDVGFRCCAGVGSPAP